MHAQSYDVKCYLFRSYISNMYCGQFWFNSTKYGLNKLRVSYNNSCRRLLRLPMRNSASEILSSAIFCHLENFYGSRYLLFEDDFSPVITQYGKFSGASCVKCMEMVAYHSIHW